ncbi:MAG: hypothetical protein ACRD1B_11620 [Thermoanaerobaculia bacterium]
MKILTISVVACLAVSPAFAAGSVRRGTVSVKGNNALSFTTTEQQIGSQTLRTMRLCMPRHLEYSIVMTRDRKTRTFELAVCPAGGKFQMPREQCIVWSRMPVVPSQQEASARGGTDSKAIGVAALSYGGRTFEFHLQDVLSPTVQSWLAEEWVAVDPRLRTDTFQFLSIIMQIPTTGLGEELKLLVPTMPVDQIVRFSGGDVRLEPPETPPFCADD